jgi:hypothetical protein
MPKRIATPAHWFWTQECPDGFRIHTQGTGGHPAGLHWYETREEMEAATKRFIADGFQFRGPLK